MLRTVVRNIGPLHWFAGWVRYLAFARKLRRANRIYAARPSGLPPPMLRYRVHGALDEPSYAFVGEVVAESLFAALRGAGVDGMNLDMLDFACGPGRVATEMKRLAPTCNLQGSDIDRQAIGWAREHLQDVGRFMVNAPLPPTRYADARFDVIYSVSLFTHLDERTQDAWLQEMARILRPGGCFITSVHGAAARRSCSAKELREIAEGGIAYRVGRKGRFKLDGLPDFYQTTFHSRDYVARRWGEVFELVDYVEGGLGGDQDLVVMRGKVRK